MPSQGLRRRLALIGGLCGLLVWVYDYDFFLNAGGPEVPISRAILRATALEGGEMIVIVFWPAVVLVLAGAMLGRVAFWLIARSDRSNAKPADS